MKLNLNDINNELENGKKYYRSNSIYDLKIATGAILGQEKK